MKVGFLVSGNLGFNVISSVMAFVKPVFIATDKNSEEVIQLAQDANFPIFIGNPRKGKLSSFMEAHQADLILSINYLFLIEPDVFNKVKFAINFHGSLLPKYRGRTPHVWAIINNEKTTGVTAHLIDKGCDTGDVILQSGFAIEERMTGADILARFNSIYPEMIKQVLELCGASSFKPKPQDNSKATYFGKRTPDDGEINWDWQRERIYNWVRAQAFPYPGAFTWYKGEKIIIDEISFSDYGFSYSDPNGLILFNNQKDVVVKCENGAIALMKIRDSDISSFKPGKIFGHENRK